MEGADTLAAFAEGLSKAEWRAIRSTRGTDLRSVGVIVHHVATVYPIEIELARAIASGKAVTDVTLGEGGCAQWETRTGSGERDEGGNA